MPDGHKQFQPSARKTVKKAVRELLARAGGQRHRLSVRGLVAASGGGVRREEGWVARQPQFE